MQIIQQEAIKHFRKVKTDTKIEEERNNHTAGVARGIPGTLPTVDITTEKVDIEGREVRAEVIVITATNIIRAGMMIEFTPIIMTENRAPHATTTRESNIVKGSRLTIWKEGGL